MLVSMEKNKIKIQFSMTSQIVARQSSASSPFLSPFFFFLKEMAKLVARVVDVGTQCRPPQRSIGVQATPTESSASVPTYDFRGCGLSAAEERAMAPDLFMVPGVAPELFMVPGEAASSSTRIPRRLLLTEDAVSHHSHPPAIYPVPVAIAKGKGICSSAGKSKGEFEKAKSSRFPFGKFKNVLPSIAKSKGGCSSLGKSKGDRSQVGKVKSGRSSVEKDKRDRSPSVLIVDRSRGKPDHESRKKGKTDADDFDYFL